MWLLPVIVDDPVVYPQGTEFIGGSLGGAVTDITEPFFTTFSGTVTYADGGGGRQGAQPTSTNFGQLWRNTIGGLSQYGFRWKTRFVSSTATTTYYPALTLRNGTTILADVGLRNASGNRHAAFRNNFVYVGEASGDTMAAAEVWSFRVAVNGTSMTVEVWDSDVNFTSPGTPTYTWGPATMPNSADNFFVGPGAATGVTATHSSFYLTDNTAPAAGTLTFVSSTWASASELVAVAKVANATTVRIEATPTGGGTTLVGSGTAPDSANYVRLTVAGLSADTDYDYEIFVDNTSRRTGTITTLPPASGAQSFNFGWGSCFDTLTSGVFALMAARPMAFFGMVGDWNYQYITGGPNGNTSPTDVATVRSHREATLASATPQGFFTAVPTAYTYSDCDGAGANSDGTTGGHATGAVQAAYRQQFAHPTLPLTNSGARSWVIGRVRFVQTDETAAASDKASTDNSSKTKLGTEQKTWFKGQIDDAVAAGQAVVWLGDGPWISATGGGATNEWARYNTERTELGTYISTSGVKLVRLHGDSHTLFYDNGTNNSWGGFPTASAAPIHTTAQPYSPTVSGGKWPTSTTNSSRQYGIGEVTDDGTTLTLTLRGWGSTTGSPTEVERFTGVVDLTSVATTAQAVLDTAGTGPLTVSRPAGAAVGDLLLMFVAVDTSTVTVTAPSGLTFLDFNTDAPLRIYAWSRVMAAGEPSSYSWTFSAATKAVGAVIAMSGVGSTPITAFNYQNEPTTNDTAHATPSITAGAGDVLLAVGVDLGSLPSWTSSGADTQRLYARNAAATGLSLVAFQSGAVSAGSHSRTLTASAGSSTASAWLFAISQGVGVTPVTTTYGSTWHTRAAVAQSHTSTWHARAGVTRTHASTWHARQAITKTVAGSWAVRSAVAQTSASSWAVRVAISAASASTWAVRTSLARSHVSSWSVRTSLAATVASSWAVRAVVTRSHASTWHTQGLAVSTLSTTWDIEGPVLSTWATLWHVRSAITRSSASTWHTRSAVSVASASSWVVRSAVTSASASTWHTRAGVTRTLASTWAVRVVVTSGSTSTWAVALAVGRTHVSSWAVRAGVVATAASTWAVRSAVIREHPSAWQVRSLAATSLTSTWDVEQTGQVVAAFDSTWHVRSLALASAATGWHVRVSLARTHASTWAIRTTVSRSYATTWGVGGSVTTALASTWHAKAAVSRSAASTWHVAQLVAATSASLWAVRVTVVRTHSSLWGIGGTVTATLVTSWAVRTVVARTYASAWHLRAHVSMTLATSWVTQGKIVALLATVWQVRAGVTTAHPSTWTVRVPVTPRTVLATWAVRALATSTHQASWNVEANIQTAYAFSWNVRTSLAASWLFAWAVLTRVAPFTYASTWDIESLAAVIGPIHATSRPDSWNAATRDRHASTIADRYRTRGG